MLTLLICLQFKTNSLSNIFAQLTALIIIQAAIQKLLLVHAQNTVDGWDQGELQLSQHSGSAQAITDNWSSYQHWHQVMLWTFGKKIYWKDKFLLELVPCLKSSSQSRLPSHLGKANFTTWNQCHIMKSLDNIWVHRENILLDVSCQFSARNLVTGCEGA